MLNCELISEIFEAIMIILFGMSWPMSVYKSWKARTSEGKSLSFELIVWVGYLFGIGKNFFKHADGSSGFIFYLAWAFYVVNFIMINMDIALYFRNARLDKAKAKEKV